jgi:erythromycin esterase
MFRLAFPEFRCWTKNMCINMIRIALWLAFCLFAAAPTTGAESQPEAVVDVPSAWHALVRQQARKLTGPDDLDSLVLQAGRRDLVLLGEATHGSHEFYTWRDHLSRRLIEEQGFDFVAVEGDSAALSRLDDYVQGRTEGVLHAADVLRTFTRWPVWMWRNREFAEFAEWLRAFNLSRAPAARVGVIGFDIYAPWSAMKNLLVLLKRHRPEIEPAFAAQLSCFGLLGDSSEAISTASADASASCLKTLDAVDAALTADRQHWPEAVQFRHADAQRHLRVVRNALSYYRTPNGNDSWNLRADHMWQALAAHLQPAPSGGKPRRGIVWAHNSHIGDAYYTGLGVLGMRNIGQLSRQALGKERVFSIGLATSQGSTIAAPAWGETPGVTLMAPALADSFEALLEGTSAGSSPNWWLAFGQTEHNDLALNQTLGHRGIGVVYQPALDSLYYLLSRVPWRYDALIYLRETTPLTPLD